MVAEGEHELWSRARKGDREAFGEIFDLHAPVLYRFASRLLGPGPDAEDIVQEVLLSVLQRGGFNSSRGSLRGYLLGAVRNQARKRRHVAAEELSESIVSPEITPDRGMVRAEADNAVGAAIDGLPWAQKEVLLLYHYEELSLKEIADTLDLELAAVKSRLHRARETLRIKLQALQGERR